MRKYLLIFMMLLCISTINALPIILKPKNPSGELQPLQNFNYQIKLTTDQTCNNILYDNSFLVYTEEDGTAFIDLNISSLTQRPSYLCEYRGGNLRKVHEFPDMIFRDIWARNLYVDYMNVSNLTATNLSGTLNWSDIQNVPNLDNSSWNETYAKTVQELITTYNSTYNQLYNQDKYTLKQSNVLYYKMDDNSTITNELGTAGTMASGNVDNITGKINNGFSFNEDELDTNYDLQITKWVESSFVLSFWINTSSITNGEVLMGYHKNNDNRVVVKHVHAGPYSNAIYIDYCAGGDCSLFVSNNYITLNEWNHVVVIFNEFDKIEVYVNNKKIEYLSISYPDLTSIDMTSFQYNTGPEFYLGGYSSLYEIHLDADLDEFSWFNRTISEYEVSLLYNNYNANTYDDFLLDHSTSSNSSDYWDSLDTPLDINLDQLSNGLTLNTPTYTSLEDWIDTTQSAGKLTGGTFTSNGDGTLNVSAGTGMIKTSNSATAETLFFDWTENLSVPLTDADTNYIYIDYNSGNPIIKSTITKSDANNRDKFLLGKVFREGNDLHIVNAGMLITEPAKNTLTYLTSVFGEVVRASGSVISETGTLNLASTSGVIFAGLTRLTTSAQDTSGTDVMEYYYYDNRYGWIENDRSVINNSHYNDVTAALVELTPNRYGVHWVYVDGDSDGTIMVVYGQGDYTLTNAELSQPPSSLPSHVADIGFLAAKIIIKKGETTFTGIESAYDTQFTSSGASVHNELAGLQGGTADEYYHLTSAEYGSGLANQFIPYTGTTANIDLGIYNLTAKSVFFGSNRIFNSGETLYIEGTSVVKIYTTLGSGVLFIDTEDVYPEVDNAMSLGKIGKLYHSIHTYNLSLGTNTITDGSMTGDWDFGGGNITTTGTINVGTIDLGTNTITDGIMNGDWDFGTYNLTTTGNITANTYFGDGSQLIGAGNSSWNESYANTLYCSLDGYNMQGNINMNEYNITNVTRIDLSNTTYGMCYNGTDTIIGYIEGIC